MLAPIGFLLAMVGVVVVVGRVGRWTGLPEAVLLTLVGLAYAGLPGPNLRLDPELVLDVVIPPLLYNTALSSSLVAIRGRLRSVISLSVLLVLATALAVGGVLSWLVPAVPLAAAVALGAAVAPPDPVAALAVGRKAGLPAKLSTLIEGEGLLNDATALTTFQVAVAVAVGGGFSFGLAVGRFALATVGGLVVGVLVAAVMRWLRRWLDDPLWINALSLATPFAAYVTAEVIHGSGVLAVVVAGLVLGHQNPRMQSGASRLQTTAVWRLVGFLLEGFVFLLIGQQLPEVVAGLGRYPISTIAEVTGITVAVVVLLRPLWLLTTQHAPRVLHTRLGGESDPGDQEPQPKDPDRGLSGAEITALSWAGTRGVITLAAAFAIPRTVGGGGPFPGRDLLLFAAYVLVLVTLLAQGVTFAPLLHRLGLRSNQSEQALLRNQARTAAVEAGLTRLDQLVEDDTVRERVAESIRQSLTDRLARYKARLVFLNEGPEALRSPAYESAAQARRDVLDAQRDELLRWRDAGRLPDSSMRILQRELDHEERLLPMPPTR
jgi:monovalent cation/hydrogen antiporter